MGGTGFEPATPGVEDRCSTPELPPPQRAGGGCTGRARRGEPDPLLTAAGLRPGETVLDATLGLGGDALLAAHATGTKVIGLEIDPLLGAFTQAGLRRMPGHGIEVVKADHRDWLRR